MRWAVYYGTGERRTDEDSDPYGLPGQNVQAVAVADPAIGRLIYSQRDFYVHDRNGDGLWRACDQYGLWEYLLEPGPRKVLFGRTIPRRQFESVMRRALEDEGLPPKSAWDDVREHRP